VTTALAANNANAGGGFFSQGGQFNYVRGIGLMRNTGDIGNVVVGANKGVPVRVRDVGEVTIGNAPRLGQFGFQNNNDAVEGVILMLRGEQTQNVLKDVEAKTDELNRQILPKDVKIHPYYDRSELVDLTTDTVENNLLARHGPGAGSSDLFPRQLPRSDDRRSYHSALAAVCVHRASCA
jgi:cobalt-zinc-cadmium resistance protein CzcA